MKLEGGQKMKSGKQHILAIMLVLLPLCSSIVAAWDTLDGPQKQNIYADWESQGDWLIIQAYADVTGERHVHAPSPDITALTHQASTFGLSYDDTRWDGRQPYTPNSRNHKITVRAISPPSSVRFTDPFGYDNSHDQSIPDILEYALDTLWGFATSYVNLPLPSPWGLLQLDEGGRLDITRDSDLKGGTFRYKAEPSLQGADWLWYIDKPVNTGWYLIDVHALAEAGLNYYPFIHVDDIDIWLFADFEVYR